ncbi:flagellar hook-length control protein FliK [Collimonas sp.]|jgi:flagellar hook-length control protein FliK|uniref:flagellar hook-length control protein FliK n=1 Tax=Collimonas sp. TaxID=1963772 RepID=UPI002BB1FAFA|nr:flagellar hook-length control protein FliK [Collimonas sp.]HWW08193.1 flagellar hook-length control protein FliK [Collimonas sp.]
MSLLVSSSSAALQATPSVSSAGKQANPQPADADNFGKVLNRSLAGADKPAAAADAAADSVKPVDRAPSRRQAGAGNDSDLQQDPSASSALNPALNFLALPQVAAKTAEANPQSGSDTPPQSAAESQLNAAIAAATGKTTAATALAAAAAPAAQASEKSNSPAAATLPPMTQLASQASAAPSRQSAATSNDAGSGEYTALTPGPQQQISGTSAGNAAGQQATSDDAHAGKHEKLEKAGRQDSLATAKVGAGQTDAAANANSGSNEIATAKAGAANSGQQNLQMDTQISTQMNPALAHGPAAASATTAPLPAAAVKLALTPTVGSDGWGTALGKQVVWMGNTNNQSAELHLNPPDLGPLKVTLTINDNQAQATFVSAHQSVRSALEAALPQLRNSLAENGINLGNTSVSSDTQQSQQQSAFAQNQSGNRGSGSQFQAAAAISDLSAKAEPSPAVASRNGNGKVDIFA